MFPEGRYDQTGKWDKAASSSCLRYGELGCASGLHSHCPNGFCMNPESGVPELMKDETWSLMGKAS